MITCKNCGASVQEGTPFCESCGSRLHAQATPVPLSPPERRDAPPQMFYPGADTKPPKGTRYAPMGVGAFLGMLLLMLIPLVNFILLIVWACGGCTNQNKRNYARAMLILLVIFLILDIALLTLLVSYGYITSDTFYSIASSLPA